MDWSTIGPICPSAIGQPHFNLVSLVTPAILGVIFVSVTLVASPSYTCIVSLCIFPRTCVHVCGDACFDFIINNRF